jgi:putative SOS response-associated peptidase YedK
MCNLYSYMRSRAEAASLGRVLRDLNHNAPPLRPAIYPDQEGPVIVKNDCGERVMRDLRWGLPSSSQAIYVAATKRADKLRAKGQEVDFQALLKLEPDGGTTNVRNTSSKHWVRWLGPENRCLVPLTSFSEPDQLGATDKPNQPIWFALDENRPLAFFAGVHVREWTCVRKIKTGLETCDLFGFLTTDAAEPVRTYHSKAQPVLLTESDQWDHWMSDAPWNEVRELQRPLADGSLKVVATGVRQDEFVPG